MRNMILAATVVVGLASGTVAMADEMGGAVQRDDAVAASMEQQSNNAQDSDPTARGSMRSHGHP